VHDRWGRVVAHGDLGFPEWRVLVEYDGRHHAAIDQFGRDLDRYSLMAADGWLTVRLGAPQLRRPIVVDRVGRALRSRGARW
jgi:very-short-patch-repair endonuclease